MARRETTSERAPRTAAQWYCLLAGAVLLLVGILGFLADGSFDTSNAEGESFLGFEVNGWHNLVHLASGILLLAAANTRPTAKTVAIGFGFVYGLVAVWGLIDGDDVLGVVPVNGADNILHVLLAAAGIAAGMASATTKREQLRRRHRGTPSHGEDAEQRLPASPSSETRRPEDAPTGSVGQPTGVPAAPAMNVGDAGAAELPAGPGRADTRGEPGARQQPVREETLTDDPEQRFQDR